MRVRAQGATRQGAPPEQNGSWRYAPGVPVTQNQTLETKQCRTRRGPTLRARGAPLALTRARGGRDHPLPTSARSPTRASIKSVAAKQNRRGKRKTRTREAQENPCRLASQEKGLRRSKENPKNARGPEWHPEKNAEKQDARPKRAKQTKAAGHKQERKPEKQVRVRGVLLLPDLCLSKEKNKPKKTTSAKNLRKRERPRKQQT